jgi:hypothetical protein
MALGSARETELHVSRQFGHRVGTHAPARGEGELHEHGSPRVGHHISHQILRRNLCGRGAFLFSPLIFLYAQRH